MLTSCSNIKGNNKEGYNMEALRLLSLIVLVFMLGMFLLNIIKYLLILPVYNIFLFISGIL